MPLRSELALAALCVVAGISAFAGAPAARAQGNATDGAGPHRAIYLYQGPDREARVLAAARSEGSVTVYTSLNTKDSVPIKDAFEKKFGVKLVLWRSSSEKVLQRGITEARAGRHSADVFETNGPEMEALYRERLLDEFWSPAHGELPPEAFPKHRHYVADRFNFFTIAYNTDLVRPEDVPNTYDDLLLPKWTGRIALEGGDTDWFGAMVTEMGEAKGLAWFGRLAEQRPQMRTGHTLLAELVAAGEVPLAAAIYNHNAERLLVKGAPIRWKALSPTFGRPNAIGVARRAPHPHAALLFADFMLSREGQELLKERNRVPASRAVDTPLNKFAFRMIDPGIAVDQSAKWEKHWSRLFLKGQAVQRDAD